MILLKRFVDNTAEAAAGPAHVRFENLPDVHSARNAQGVQNDINRRTVLEERHIFRRHDHRHDAFVTVTAGHFVARLDLALHSNEDLDHLHDARRKFVTALQLVDLIDEAAFETLLGFLVLLLDGFDFGHRLIFLETDFPPLAAGDIVENFLIDLSAFLGGLRSLGNFFAHQRVLEARVDVTVEDLHFIVAVFGEALDLFALDGHGAFVFFDAMTVEDAHFDDRTGNARRQTQRRIAHVGGLFAEDGAE